MLAHCRALTDKADVFRERARSQLRLVAAGRTIEQEDQRQVGPSPVDLLQNETGVSCQFCKRKLLFLKSSSPGHYRIIHGALRGRAVGLQRQARLQQQLLAGRRDVGVLLDPLLQLGHRLVVRHRVREDLGGHHVEDVNQLREERRKTRESWVKRASCNTCN